MDDKIDLNSVYGPSNNVIARVIEGELILVPLTSGIADLEDDLFTLNEPGRNIWQRLDGRSNVKSIINDLSELYEESSDVEDDVIGFLSELLKRKIIVKV